MVAIFVFKMTITYDKCIAIVRHFLQSNISSNLMQYMLFAFSPTNVQRLVILLGQQNEQGLIG